MAETMTTSWYDLSPSREVGAILESGGFFRWEWAVAPVRRVL